MFSVWERTNCHLRTKGRLIVGFVLFVFVTVKIQVKTEAGLLALLCKSGLVLHIFNSLLYSRFFRSDPFWGFSVE